MDKEALVSVLMPVYNAEAHIVEAAKSMLNQTHRHLELLIVDDGCTDTSIQKVLSLNDKRIRVISNPVNLGLAASLNIAISQASGNYLARMDADDISHPERIARQIQALEKYPEISVLGTGLQYFNVSRYKNFFPPDHETCKAKLLFNVCFGHPSVVCRRKVFENVEHLYTPALKQYSEDYDLYSRLVDNFRFANLQQLYVKYRTFTVQYKSDAEQKRKNNSLAVRNRMLNRMGIEPTAAQQEIHRYASDLSQQLNDEVYQTILNWFEFLNEQNKQTRYFEQAALQNILAEQAYLLFYHNLHLRIGIDEMRKYSFFKAYKVPPHLWIKAQGKKILRLFK
jgi:glycosyltransferase involved in cell wall biosynthesis